MRKLIAFFLCALLLCGCGAGAADSTQAPSPDMITITKDFTLVTPKGANIAVTEAARCLQTSFDFKLKLPKMKITNDDPGSKAIVFQVDETMEAGSHKVELKGTSVYVTAQNPHILLLVTRQLRQLMLDNKAGAVVTKEMCAQLSGIKDMTNLPFRFLSQNILFKNIEGGNTVPDRQPRFKSLMNEYCPDILAVQEHSADWSGFIRAEFGATFTAFAAEGLAFYFRTDRYEILETGNFFLSPTPNVYSQFEGDSGPRKCIWAIATDKFTDTTILFINCHPDWNNDTQRTLQVDVIFEVMGEKMKQYPTIFCGDFNTRPDGPIYPRITQDFKDPYKEAEVNLSEIDFTCHGFGAQSTFIDYSFYSDAFKPTEYRIINDMYNGHVSDHYGTYTDFILAK